MRSLLQRVLASVTALVAVATTAVAQGGGAGSADVTVRGTVTSEVGAPIPGVNVFLQGMNVGAQTDLDGHYAFTVGAARATGETVALVARVIGYAPKAAQVTLTAGAAITQDFTLAANPLHLDQVVVTGAGLSTTRERLTTTINTVDSSFIRRATQPQNVVSALAGAAPGVEVRTQSGDPGASATIRIRGVSSLTGTGQPLFVIDGQPVDNTTEATSATGSAQASLQGTVTPNRVADINPSDIESIDILKGAAAAAIYGARGANGVVLITTNRGHAGPTHYSFSSTETSDHVQPNVALQRSYGQGSGGAPPPAGCGETVSFLCSSGSWGPLLSPGTPTYNHETEIFQTGMTADNFLSASGGNDRMTFYASGGLTAQNGVVVGPNNKYNRATARLKGTDQITSTLNIGGNLNYIDTRGSYVEKGNAFTGLLLGALRTPPDFNNQPYIDPVTGLPRSYRLPNPIAGTETQSRGYDDPFFAAYVPVARSELGRLIGNTNLEWTPLGWLDVKYTLGADSYSDWRLESVPQGGSSDAVGHVIRNDYDYLEIDHNLIATATHTFSDDLNGSFTLGQNLNSRRRRNTYVFGEQLVAPTPFTLQNTLTYIPTENRSLAHIEAYFAQGELDLYKQLYLNALIRDDGFSTFGPSKRHALYPSASVAWDFTHALGKIDSMGVLSYGKLRLSYGETGKEPPLYASNTTLSNQFSFSSGFGDFLNTNQSGQGGLTESGQLGNTNLRPERDRESEIGADLGFFDQRADMSLVVYDKRATDVILPVTVNTAQTGAIQAFANAAAVTNRGVELSLNLRPYETKNVSWELGVQFSHNHGFVQSLAGAQSIVLNSFSEGLTGAVGSATIGFAPGVIRGTDFVRCGRGLQVDVGLPSGATNVDSLCAAYAPNGKYAKGALFIGPDGLPVQDPTDRVIADPNPKYMMSYTTSVLLHNRLRLSALVDVRKGGEVWDGTRAALSWKGTAAGTLVRSSTDAVFGKNFMTDVYPNAVGPGVGIAPMQSLSDWEGWFSTLGGLPGPQAQFIEDGSFVKLRELSLTYTLTWPAPLGRAFSSADVRIAGRNLHTWTRYQGFDPEANLAGAESLTQGIDFFNNPQTRSFVLSLSLNR